MIYVKYYIRNPYLFNQNQHTNVKLALINYPEINLFKVFGHDSIIAQLITLNIINNEKRQYY